MGGWRPSFGGLCTPGSAVHPRVCCAPAFPADLYLSERRGLLCPGWSQFGVVGPLQFVFIYCKAGAAGRARKRRGSQDSGAAAAISPSLPGTPATLSRINVS